MVVNGTNFLVQQERRVFTKMPNAQSFVKAVEAALVEHRIRDTLKPTLPMASSCSQPMNCPTEEDFCEVDPRCVAEPKYQEPNATTQAGPIAGIVVAVSVVLIAGLYLLHRKAMKDQAMRNQSVFARRIAETIKLSGPDRVLTPEALAEEFKKIDNGNVDGNIDKAELQEFVSGDFRCFDASSCFGFVADQSA